MKVTISKKSMEAIGGLRVQIQIIILNGGDDKDWTPGRVLIRDAADGAFISAIKGNFDTVTRGEIIRAVAEYIRG